MRLAIRIAALIALPAQALIALPIAAARTAPPARTAPAAPDPVAPGPAVSPAEGYSQLTELFTQWRNFERPLLHGYLPDYGAEAMAVKASALTQWQAARGDLYP